MNAYASFYLFLRRLEYRLGKVFPNPRERPRFLALIGKPILLNCELCEHTELILMVASLMMILDGKDAAPTPTEPRNII